MTERLFEVAGSAAPEGMTTHAVEETAKARSITHRRIVLLVAYDGTDFHGFAEQSSEAIPTVGGALRKALSRVAGEDVTLTCAGRTDKGVHALGQVVHSDLPADLVGRLAEKDGELERLARSLSGQCGPSVSVRRVALAPDGFDARHSARSRRYRYELLVTPYADPLWRHRSWHVPDELDISAMRVAADGLLGEHDFSAFCRRPPGQDGPLTRRVIDARFDRLQDPARLGFEIEANAFCHQMVRSIVGHLVAVGEGRLPAVTLRCCLERPERSAAAAPAPREGLVLLYVTYPEELVASGRFG